MSGLDWISNFSSPLWVGIGNHLLQSTGFALVLGTVLIFLNTSTSHARCLLGWLALLKFAFPLSIVLLAINRFTYGSLSPPILDIGTASPLEDLIQGVLLPIESTSAPMVTRFGSEMNFFPVIGIVWLGGFFFVLTIRLVRFYLFSKYLSESIIPASDELSQRVNILHEKLSISGNTTIWLIKDDIEPVVFGIFDPKIIISENLYSELNHTELDAVLSHELAHIKRYDNLLGIFRLFIVSALWFHPLIWWFDRLIFVETEKACDDMVLNLSRDIESYASALCKVSLLCLGVPVQGFSAISQGQTVNRLKRILNFKKDKDRWRHTRPLIFFFTAMLFLTSILGTIFPKISIDSISPVQRKIKYWKTDSEPELNKENVLIMNEVYSSITSYNGIFSDDDFDPKIALSMLENLKTETEDAAYEFTLGCIYYKNGETEAAIQHYLKSIELYPNFLRAHKNIGYVYLHQGDLTKSREHFIEVINLGEEKSKYFALVGLTYLKKADLRNAEYYYSEALMRDPSNALLADQLSTITNKNKKARS